MTEVYNYKNHLPEPAQRHYIDNALIELHLSFEEPDISSAAHVMVGERHGKFDLVHMTAYMLSQINRLQQERQGHINHIALLKASLKQAGQETDSTLERVKALKVALEHCLDWLPADCSAACEAAALLGKS